MIHKWLTKINKTIESEFKPIRNDLVKNASKKDIITLRKYFINGKMSISRDWLLDVEQNKLNKLKKELIKVNFNIEIIKKTKDQN